MSLKTLTVVTSLLSLSLAVTSRLPCRADFAESKTAPAATTPAPSDPARAEGRVLVVLVYDQHCKVWCNIVRPIIRELAVEFGDKVHVEEIDNSPSSAEIALKQVKDLGILKLYKDVESVPCVMIFDVKRKDCKELSGPKKKEVYKAAIEKVIAKGE